MDETNSKRLKTEGRICLLTSNFPRWDGDATTPFVLHLAQDLIQLGWQVEVLAPHAPGAARHEILHGVPIWRFRYFWPESQETVCYQGGALINLRKRRTNWGKLPFLVAAEWLALLVRVLGKRYDLLHAHWILPQGFVAVAVGWLCRLPVVVTVHGSDATSLNWRPLLWFKSVTLRRAEVVTVNSSTTMTAVHQIAPGLGSVRRIPMGVTVTSESTRSGRERLRRRFRRGEGPLLVFVGRLVEQKGVDDFIRAVSLLTASLPDVTAIIAGEGQDRHSFESLAAGLGLGERIHFLGWVDPERVPEHLAAADVFIGPSRRDRDGSLEAQGLVFLEAMLAGTPVVATRLGGVVDFVSDGQTGLLVKENAPDEISEAVMRLVADPALRQRLSREGHDLVMRRFTRDMTAKAFSELFATHRRRRKAGGAT